MTLGFFVCVRASLLKVLLRQAGLQLRTPRFGEEILSSMLDPGMPQGAQPLILWVSVLLTA